MYWEKIPDLIKAHKLISETGLSDLLRFRIPIESGLNIDKWMSYLCNYWDPQLCDPLQYGFPIYFNGFCPLISSEVNHSLIINYSEHVQEYIQEELQFQAILGPFREKPIQLHVSPLMIRDKQNSSSKRTIMDPSWPHWASVNDGVRKDVCLETTYELHYPSIDLITNSSQKLGTSAQIYKIDISRAFIWIKVDPADIDLLGIIFDHQYYIDRSIQFGFHHGSLIFHRCTDAIHYIMAQHGFQTFFN